jgi:exodeoxyribonuclease VII large subunit
MPSKKTPSQQGLFDFTAPARAVPSLPPAVDDMALPVRSDARLLASGASTIVDEKLTPKTYSVVELVRAASRTLEARYGTVWVEGEVSNLSQPRSGHLYFTLKDAEAQLPSVMFKTQAQRLAFRLEDGLKVRARGRLSIYEGQGKFQLYVDALEPTGVGAAQLAFEQLKRKLAAEGLFDPARKRPLPRWPRRIGLATSTTGAAVRDVLRIAERRGRVRFLVAGCQVQGDGAAATVRAALAALAAVPDVDVIIVARGGGSAEDLAAFNDEALARAIRACRVPVVSAVGHEVDFTIADFVADLRAPTPSAAAELVVPLFADAAARLDEAHARLLRGGRRALAEARQRLDQELARGAQAVRQIAAGRRRLLDGEARRLAALHPRARLHRDRAALAALRGRLDARLRELVNARRHAFAAQAGKLGALSPLAVLERGYSLTRTVEGHVVTGAEQVQRGDALTVELARGRLGCRVESVDPEKGK